MRANKATSYFGEWKIFKNNSICCIFWELLKRFLNRGNLWNWFTKDPISLSQKVKLRGKYYECRTLKDNTKLIEFLDYKSSSNSTWTSDKNDESEKSKAIKLSRYKRFYSTQQKTQTILFSRKLSHVFWSYVWRILPIFIRTCRTKPPFLPIWSGEWIIHKISLDESWNYRVFKIFWAKKN